MFTFVEDAYLGPAMAAVLFVGILVCLRVGRYMGEHAIARAGDGRPPLHWTARKAGIHPEYVEAHVRCTCGNEFTTRSTKPELHVEICSNCHPFYTGKQKLVDTGGRVERFQRRAAKRARAGAG